MAVVFLLGPGMWDSSKKSHAHLSPMDIRRKIAKQLREGGHDALLMEDDPDREGEDLIHKFDRLLRQDITDVIVYWPPLAKMQTTFDELILLCDRSDFLKKNSIAIWLLHHSSVATIRKDEFRILETGQRSRYLTAVVRLGVASWPWEDEEDLMNQVRELAEELDA